MTAWYTRQSIRRAYRAAAASACLIVTACGGAGPDQLSPPADREWVDNTSGVIDQLQRDLDLGAIGGLSSARQALREGLYIPLVAFTDFGGCDHMVSGAGRVPSGFEKVARTLDRACALLQRSAALFTRAAAVNDARVLVEAGRVAERAEPLLVHAKFQIQAAIATRKS